MFSAIEHDYLVPFDGSFRVADSPTRAADRHVKLMLRRSLRREIKQLRDLQRRLYAQDRFAVLLVFQAMDAAGKDGTIRAVMSGVNPAGCQVFSFKKPSAQELDHDFLWRSATRLPERGRIGIFNRSYYEEVLVVRVHPKMLDYQRLPDETDPETIWQDRFESIADHERHLARNGTVIIKFWLNVSPEEQLRRFVARLDDPDRLWKFSKGDLDERAHWDAYMRAYEESLAATSKPWAPWYAVPADNKSFMRLTVAQIVVANLKRLGLDYPAVDAATRAEYAQLREDLVRQQQE